MKSPTSFSRTLLLFLVVIDFANFDGIAVKLST